MAAVFVIGVCVIGALPAHADNMADDTADDTADKTIAMRMRSGDHDGYSRVVFDWPLRVGYTLAREAGDLLVIFDRPATVNAGALGQRPLWLAANPRVEERNGGVVVRLDVPADARVKAFRNGDSIVVDLRPGDAPPRLDMALRPAADVAGGKASGEAGSELARVRRQAEAVRDA
ncbi:MAG: hypothetical protein D6782_11660, partial [Alphaproteobacteria bacterium]